MAKQSMKAREVKRVKLADKFFAKHPIAMDDGLRFAIREGGRTVGAGVVAKVIA